MMENGIEQLISISISFTRIVIKDPSNSPHTEYKLIYIYKSPQIVILGLVFTDLNSTTANDIFVFLNLKTRVRIFITSLLQSQRSDAMESELKTFNGL